MSDEERETSKENDVLLGIVAAEVVGPSFERCSRHGHAIFDSFYSNLADHLPEIGQMFVSVDMKRQNQLIRVGINHLIHFAEGYGEAVSELDRLGKSHGPSGLDVPEELYEQWSDTLCQTVQEHDSQATLTTIRAWHAVLKHGIARIVAAYE